MPLAPAFRLGPYEIVELLSVGGMGEVYRARDTRLGRQVAVKVLPRALAADPERLFRFEQEAQAAGALNHPNIVAIYDVGSEDDISFVVSELIDGVTLRDRLRDGPLPRALALEYGAQMGRALGAAHAAGVVHRDLKPENVMITRDDRVKIVDFGIAKLDGPIAAAGDDRETALHTMPGTLVGTVSYMSPEQVRGERLDHRTDIFNLGVILYEALAGRHPFAQATPAETMSAILRDEPAPIAGLDADLEWIVRHAIEKSRDSRFQSALDVALALEAFVSGRQARTPAPSPAPGAERSVRTIAVLPFVNLAPDQESEYFSDGLTEELIQALTGVRGLQVVAWQSAAQLKGRERDAQAIGRDLNVDHVLVGTVRRAADRVRIAVRLLQVTSGYYVWSDTYDRRIEDVFAIQEEIATAIVATVTRALGAHLAPVVTQRRASNMEAYNQYLQGRFFWNKRTSEGLRRSIECFERALAIDEHFALAHAGLADAWCLLADYGLMHPGEALPRARSAALRALEIDPRCAEAHASFGLIRSLYDWEWPEAEALFRRAIELRPGYATAHHWLAIDFLATLGRLDESAEEVEIARQLDPLSMIIQEGGAYLLTLAHRYDDAIDSYQALIELDPSFYKLFTSLGRAYLQKGAYPDAIAMLEKGRQLAGDLPSILGALGQAHALAGERQEARGLLDALGRLSGTRYVPATAFAVVHTGLGEHNAALEWLERGCAQHELSVTAINSHPAYDALRDEPRFKAMLRRMRLSE